MTSSSSEKRCLYEILGLKRDCTSDEIRSAYRKLALQRHPDKLIKSGVTEAEATASFQELVNAYEVLSDARERAWYDSHRSQILFSGKNHSSSGSASGVPDLFKYFTNSVFSGFSDRGKGFYKVYGDVFDKIFRNELSYVVKLGEEVDLKEAPLFGNLESGYEQVNAFYGYWFGFATVMDFAWVDEYDVMSGGNRKSRRVMEEENKKIRKKARREFNETVRGLAEFVKKRDKRVIDMQVKRNEEIERKKEEEKARKAELAREKAERARMFEVPDWAKVEEEVEEEELVEEEKRNELYCVACGKKFKSDKQWKNHEQSKKHKEKVAELRDAFVEEDGDDDDDDDGEGEGDGDEFVSADEVEKVKERFEGVEICEEEKEDGRESEVEEEYVEVDNGEKGLDGNEGEEEEEDDDDEVSVLKAMLKNRKNVGAKKPKGYAKKNVYVEVEEEEVDLMEYNNTKGRRRRGGRKETAERDEDEEHKETGKPETSSKPEVDEKSDDGSNIEETTSSKPFADSEKNGGDDKPRAKIKVPKQAPAVKVTNKKEVNSKGKNSARGKKQKATTSRSSQHECDTCGVDFDSRTKLFKHLSDTGHATLKSR